MKELLEMKTQIESLSPFKPKIGLVLGSGLGGFISQVQVEKIIPYKNIPRFPTSTVEGHKGEFVFANYKNIPLLLMNGRVHFYEGYSMEEVVAPIRLMRLLGVQSILLTNAAGGCNPKFQPGDLMMITDQISSFVPSPLIGANKEDLGIRFPDMTHIYHPKIQEFIKNSGKELALSLKTGTYLQFSGPAYESPAEIRMAQALGADAVGMSTACEAIAANHMGLAVGGISCISNMASGLSSSPLNHQDVQAVGQEVSKKFTTLVKSVIQKLGEIEL